MQCVLHRRKTLSYKLKGKNVNRSLRIVVVLVALAIMSAWAAPVTQVVQLNNGNEFTIFVAGPDDSDKGILLVHDWFGVSPFYHAAADKLAKNGFRVVSVDLYGGQSATTHTDAWNLMKVLDADQVAAKIDRTLDELRTPGRQIAIMGFSMGTQHAFSAALRHDAITATVIWYGDTINDSDELKKLNGPVLAVYGSKDGPAADNAAIFSKAADGAGAAAEIWVYPGAQHAFAQPLFNQGTTYDPVATAAAWRLTVDFLARQFE